jgi:hypothetical protein
VRTQVQGSCRGARDQETSAACLQIRRLTHDRCRRVRTAGSGCPQPDGWSSSAAYRTAVRVRAGIAVSDRRGPRLWPPESDGATTPPGRHRCQAERTAGADYLAALAIYAATMYVACRSRLPRARSYRIVVLGSACEAASCTSRKGTPASSAAVMKACLSVWGVTDFAIPARRVVLRTIRPAPCRSSRRPSARQQVLLDRGPFGQ